MLDRRSFVKGAGLAASSVALSTRMALPASAAGEPTTGFEDAGGARWTTHAEEMDFLARVADTAPNAPDLTVVGRTAEDRPVHLVRLGVADALRAPTLYVIGSQHGNEPSGREACLKLVRDLAFTDDPALLALLSRVSIIVTPSANPDGRTRNSRGNSRGTDINRDHLNLETEEARAMAGVHNRWRPSLVVDHHEYSGAPVQYDDDLQFLWPRNLNVDQQVHDLARSFCFDFIQADSFAAGYTADEYGQQKVGPYVGPVDVTDVTGREGLRRSQTAGDEDDGIARNAMGLRHSLGILVESYVSAQPYRPGEVSGAGLMLRRVDSQRVCMDAELRFMAELGEAAADVTGGARDRKALEGATQSAPVYFYGADNDPPAPSEIQDPAPLRYRLSADQAAEVAEVLALHGVAVSPAQAGDVVVSLAQAAEPVIPLLLDDRGRRNMVPGVPEYT